MYAMEPQVNLENGNFPDDSPIGKLKKNPLFIFASTGLFSIIGYKLYKIKEERKAGSQMRLSLQLINTRLYAQGFVIGTLSLSVFYALGKRIYDNLTSNTPSTPSWSDNKN